MVKTKSAKSIKKSATKRGKLIVIDGTDGSGKATQTKLLIARLKKAKQPVATIEFPRYYDNHLGALVGECLAGEHGDFLAIDPKIASTLYAADRFESKAVIEGWLAEGKTVVADRYASSNQIHQTAKLRNKREQRTFLSWLDTLEYEVFGIPRPDLVLFLHLSARENARLLKDNYKKAGKEYLKGKKDQAEEDLEHQDRARKSALALIAESNTMKKIECVKNGGLLPPEEIHELVYDEVIKIL